MDGRLLLGALAVCALTAGAPTDAPASPDDTRRAVAAVIDGLHAAASKADESKYFAYFAPDGVFVGTDATEIWSVEAFRAYAHPHFSKGQGWTYVPRPDRRVRLGADGRTAWFYETLDHAKYGVLRGSGVLVLLDGQWRVAQYVLSFAVPNDKAAAALEAMGFGAGMGEGPGAVKAR